MQISKEWKRMSDEEKAPYLESAKNDKVRYMQEMEKWKNSMTTPENEQILNKLADLRSISSGRAKRSLVPRVKKVRRVKKLAKTKPKSKKPKSKAKSTKTKSTKSKSKLTKSASTKVKTGSKKKKSETVEVKDETSSSSDST
jgi:upstream-binding transcription factor